MKKRKKKEKENEKERIVYIYIYIGLTKFFYKNIELILKIRVNFENK